MLGSHKKRIPSAWEPGFPGKKPQKMIVPHKEIPDFGAMEFLADFGSAPEASNVLWVYLCEQPTGNRVGCAWTPKH